MRLKAFITYKLPAELKQSASWHMRSDNNPLFICSPKFQLFILEVRFIEVSFRFSKIYPFGYTVLSFEKNIYSCVVTTTIIIWNPESSLMLLYKESFPNPQLLAITDLISIPIILSFTQCHINGSTRPSLTSFIYYHTIFKIYSHFYVISNLYLFTAEQYLIIGYITTYLSPPLLICIWLEFSFGQLSKGAINIQV